MPEPEETALGPEALAVLRAEYAEVLALIAALPVKLRTIVRMRAQGIGANEVGAVFGMTGNAVRIAHLRALVKLRASRYGDPAANPPSSGAP